MDLFKAIHCSLRLIKIYLGRGCVICLTFMGGWENFSQKTNMDSKPLRQARVGDWFSAKADFKHTSPPPPQTPLTVEFPSSNSITSYTIIQTYLTPDSGMYRYSPYSDLYDSNFYRYTDIPIGTRYRFKPT